MSRLPAILAEISTTLNELPGVFSTAQWGGRAFKLPGPRGDKRKPKLLAFVTTTREEDAVAVGFKLAKDRAAACTERYGWIEPHSFSSLGRAGWLEARLTTKRQAATLRKLLAESRTLYPDPTEIPATESPGPSRAASSASSAARHIDRVMREATAEGWTPPRDDAFEV